MSTFKKNLVALAKIIALGLIVGVFTSYALASWTEPPANPPAGNTEPPINVSNVGQIKVGGLTLNTGGAATGLSVPQGDVKFDLPSGKISYFGLSTEASSTSNHNVRVYGNVDADYYCDRNGVNCHASSEIGGGGSGLDEKVKGSATDTTAGYLDAKVQNSLAVLSNKLQLLNDITTPGNNKCYGSSNSGVKGWYTCDIDGNAGSGSGSGLDEKVKGSSTDTTAGYLDAKIQNSIAVVANKLQLLNDMTTPGNNKCYGSNATGVKGWYTCNVDTTAGGVSKIIAGTNITISPTSGVGDVTISAAGSSGGTLPSGFYALPFGSYGGGTDYSRINNMKLSRILKEGITITKTGATGSPLGIGSYVSARVSGGQVQTRVVLNSTCDSGWINGNFAANGRAPTPGCTYVVVTTCAAASYQGLTSYNFNGSSGVATCPPTNDPLIPLSGVPFVSWESY